MSERWFYTPAEPLYIGKHAKKYPAPQCGGYVSRAIPVEGTVTDRMPIYNSPQVKLRMEHRDTLKDTLHKMLLSLKLGRKIRQPNRKIR